MKKSLSVILVLVLAVSAIVFTGCGAEEEKTYVSVAVEFMGQTEDAEEQFKLIQKGAGKAVISMEGDSLEGSWKEEKKNITFTFEEDGEVLDLVCVPGEKDTLICEDFMGMGIKVIFAIEGSRAADPALYLK